MSHPIRVVDYDSRWPGRFLAEAERIRRALDELVVALHHIGSTSVPGLCAKPVIDIFLQVSSLTRLDEQTGALVCLGYESMGAHGLPGRRFFRKGGSSRSHHIHAYAASNPEPLRHLHFRDYLRSHPEVAERYGEIKREAARAHGNDREKYCEWKAPFIGVEEARALSWVQTRELPGGGLEDEPVGDSETLYGVPVMRFPSEDSAD